MPKGQKLGGRTKGVPNKVTTDVRAAIAVFAQANVGNMGVWLNEIEDPAKRLDLYLRAIEYHLPKLGRMEVTGANGGPVQTERIERLIVDPANTDRKSLPPAA
jgi:putative AlgH/UPF0301 family transcriptional regulator